MIAAFHPPEERARNYTHHLAAGVVFAALTTEISPQMMAGERRAFDVVFGFSVGVALMLFVRHFTEAGTARRREAAGDGESPKSLVAAVGVDLLIDGLLLGIGFALGEQAGKLLTIALATEALFVCLATAAALPICFLFRQVRARPVSWIRRAWFRFLLASIGIRPSMICSCSLSQAGEAKADKK